MYTRPEDDGLSVVIPAPKEQLEKVLGPLSQEDYEKHVWDRSIPKDAINPRVLPDDGLPSSREFRNAWCDVTPEASVDIDLVKAKDLKLEEMRVKRQAALDKTDRDYIAALSKGDDAQVNAVKLEKQRLRDLTTSLKTLSVKGYNDISVLNKIKELSNGA